MTELIEGMDDKTLLQWCHDMAMRKWIENTQKR